MALDLALPKLLMARVCDRVSARLRPAHYTRAYSQEGEDLILNRVFGGQPSGFYVDVGAHHPTRYSNTHLFYERGWRGINIDAMPGTMDLFKVERPRDLNVEAAVGVKSGEIRTLYVFNEPSLTSLDESLARGRENRILNHRIVAEHEVVLHTLCELLDLYLPPGQQIDFMSVDVEGLDFEVLQSNAWEVYRPEYLLAEAYGLEFRYLSGNDIFQYMTSQGYEIFAKTVNTLIFQDTSVKRGPPNCADR